MGGSDRDKGVTLVVLAVCLTGGLIIAGCNDQAPQQKTLKIIAAGSLLAPFAQAEQEFEAAHPGVDVQIEGHGSIQVIRQVTDLHRTADLLAVADESLIPDLMYRPDKTTGKNYTDWYLPFATNEMVITYTNKSRYHDEINQENWYQVIARPDVRLGFSNPMLDAAGYRALMVVQLAEEEYSDPALFEQVIAEHFPSTINVTTNGTTTTIALPEIMRPSDDKVVIRDGSIYLLSLLEAGGIDYAIEYKSVADGMNLSYITLPASINLGSADYADQYRHVTIVLGFPRFSTIGQERTGRPIVYAVTIPANAPNPELAREFIDYTVNETAKGRYGWPPPLWKRGNMTIEGLSRPKRPLFSGQSLIAFWIPGMVLVGVIILALLVIAIPVLQNPEYLASAAADPVVFQAFIVTFLAGFCAVGILALLGTPLAYALSRSESPYKGIVETLVDIPLVLPHTVAGLMVYLLFMSRGVFGAPLGELGLVFEDAFPGIVAAMVFVSIPYYVNAVREGFGRVPVQLENVARSLGASRFRMFWSVTLPLTTRHILYGALLAWGRAIGEFAAVIMIAYFPVVISTLIYYRFNTGGIEESQAIAFLLILLCLVMFFVFRFLTRRAGVYDDRS